MPLVIQVTKVPLSPSLRGSVHLLNTKSELGGLGLWGGVARSTVEVPSWTLWSPPLPPKSLYCPKDLSLMINPEYISGEI